MAKDKELWADQVEYNLGIVSGTYKLYKLRMQT